MTYGAGSRVIRGLIKLGGAGVPTKVKCPAFDFMIGCGCRDEREVEDFRGEGCDGLWKEKRDSVGVGLGLCCEEGLI